VVDATHFTYTDSTSGLAAGSGGTATNGLAGVQRSMITSLVYTFSSPVSLPPVASITAASEVGNTVTITTSAASGFVAGETVYVSGVSVAGYNGTYTIATASGTTFTYNDSNAGLGAASNGSADVGFSVALHGGVSVNGGAGQTIGTLPTLSYSNPSGDGKTWVIRFSGSGVVAGSIADGVYDITLDAAAVTSSGVAALAGNRTDTFYRLKGDALGFSANGNKATVNGTDISLFKTAENKSPGATGYRPSFDFLGAGSQAINGTDIALFKANENKIWTGFTPTI
jgi:hypothetical protein